MKPVDFTPEGMEKYFKSRECLRVQRSLATRAHENMSIMRRVIVSAYIYKLHNHFTNTVKSLYDLSKNSGRFHISTEE